MYYFVCMTDGEDNSSRWSVTQTREKIIKSMEDEWTFVFLGAYQNSDRTAKDLGFPVNNIRCFEGAQMRETMQELATATKAYRAASTTKTDFYTFV